MSADTPPHNGRHPDASAQPRNWLQPFLLLSLQQWHSHGYELMQRLAVFGFESMDPGGVYRTLRQLERDGLVSSSWDTDSSQGPARRVYSLTASGEAYLQTWASALRGYQSMLDSFFQTYATGSGDQRDDT
jgi:PadR family transcriptional regulator PadR